MLLLIHILSSLSSVVFAGYMFFSPSKQKLRATYGLITLTIASGTALVIVTHSSILESCMTGLVYLAIVLFEVQLARKKLARTEN